MEAGEEGLEEVCRQGRRYGEVWREGRRYSAECQSSRSWHSASTLTSSTVVPGIRKLSASRQEDGL